jgi:hypothetical protein
MDNLLAGNLIPPFSGRFACRVVIQRRPPLGLWKSFRDQADHESGIGPIDDRLPVGIADRLQPGTLIGIIPER